MALKPPDKLPSWTMQSSRNSLFHLDLTLFGAGTIYQLEAMQVVDFTYHDILY